MSRRDSVIPSETDSICGNKSEPANRLSSTMRTIGVKRPKCHSKFIVMAVGTSVFLLTVGIIALSMDFSSESVEKVYEGEFWQLLSFTLRNFS